MSVVKTVQFFIPNPDLTTTRKRVVIIFDGKSNLFKIKIPDHIADVLKGERNCKTTRYGRDEKGQGWVEEEAHIQDATVEGATYECVVSAFEQTLKEYEGVLKDLKRRKIIVVKFKANLYLDVEDASKLGMPIPYGRIEPNACVLRRDDCGFNYNPSMGLEYFVCYEAGGAFYRLEDMTRLGSMDDYADPVDKAGKVLYARDDNLILECTEERERFFESARLGLIKTIASIDSFINAVHNTPEVLDAWIAKVQLLGATGDKVLSETDNESRTEDA